MAILDSRSEDGQGRQVDVEEQLFYETIGEWCVCGSSLEMGNVILPLLMLIVLCSQ